MLTFSRLIPLGLIALLAGCTQTAPATSTTGSSPIAATAPLQPPLPLVGTPWKLKELAGQTITRTPPQQQDITLLLDGGRVSGHSGCNRMMGAYGTNGSSTLTFSQFAGTMMACQPADMALERDLLKRLSTVNGYRYDGQDLLLTSDGVVVARYEATTRHF
ncbi:META domain-containing protein [Janthinobacterium sp. Mn2066]|uniref:META domain-containing protein n=1 Tax=Janthinobacterium sp. Mn2066 TaxID=3395264 RepID=UPI003BD1DFEA